MTKPTQLRKNNHYVPQLYLKQWMKNGKIPTYRLLVPNDGVHLWKDHSLKSIAYHQHLYSYLVGQEETDEFERWLSNEFEAPAEEAIHLAINDERMSQEHWKTLIRFAFAQDIRTPANLRSFLARQRDTMQQLMTETLETSVRHFDAATKAGTLIPNSKPVLTNPLPIKILITKHPEGGGTIEARTIVGRSLWLWSVRRLLTDTINKITNSHWTIVHAPPGLSWPTSDNPLIKLAYQDSKNYSFGSGWGVPNVDIIMPLSPKHLLHNCIGRRSWPRGTVLDKQTAQFLRKIIVKHADRYIFDKDKSDIQNIRPRTVSLIAYNQERATWQNWGNEQSQAEADLFGEMPST